MLLKKRNSRCNRERRTWGSNIDI